MNARYRFGIEEEYFLADAASRRTPRRAVKRSTKLGISREQLAERVGVSASDMEEYEAGRARVRPGVLLDMAEALRIPISSFFADSYLPD